MSIERKSSAFTILLSFFLFFSSTFAAKKPYIVYLGGHSHSKDEISPLTDEKATNTHHEILGSVLKSKEKAKDAIFYSYTKYINGFAANLEEDEAMEISKHSGVVSVFPSRAYKLHTTHSWEFLGLEKDGKVPKKSLWTKANFGEDVIIGNLDTGVWPESESFKDDGMGFIPSRWKGICQNDSEEKFSCNRKLIGARYFNKGAIAGGEKINSTFSSPRDIEGHGTHTLSTAGGGPVPGASTNGFGNGTAKGGSPRARVAAYKVCWPAGGCYDTDIMAGFEAAIHDGVDVLSASIGGPVADYFRDGIAIASFHAVRNGITVVASAGNSGPDPGSVSNIAPWLVTVGASTMDREFSSYLSINKKHYKGQSMSLSSLPGNRFYPMITSSDARSADAPLNTSQLCFIGHLDPEKVKGKIVVCLRGISARVDKGVAVKQAGGVGMVLANDESTGDELIADAHVLPAVHVSYSDGVQVFSYVNNTKSPYGYMTRAKTEVGAKPAPFMAAFSSQGPNTLTPEILKPDITAPGVSVIASWTEYVSPTDTDARPLKYNSESGTSMSCPHVSGVVGLLKALHPDWSPAAIRSAIMTSARVRDNVGQIITNATSRRATPFSYGSGQVSPNRAMDPGLVYDLATNDYLNFLCSLGYNSTRIRTFSVEPYSCPSKPLRVEDLNYPSITVPNLSGQVSVSRTVKNVGPPGTYHARVNAPLGVTVTVEPSALAFSKVGEEKTFEVVLKAKKGLTAEYAFGRLTWSDGVHHVKSPIVVKAKN